MQACECVWPLAHGAAVWVGAPCDPGHTSVCSLCSLSCFKGGTACIGKPAAWTNAWPEGYARRCGPSACAPSASASRGLRPPVWPICLHAIGIWVAYRVGVGAEARAGHEAEVRREHGRAKAGRPRRARSWPWSCRGRSSGHRRGCRVRGGGGGAGRRGKGPRSVAVAAADRRLRVRRRCPQRSR